MRLKISLDIKKRPKVGDKITIQGKIELKIVEIDSKVLVFDLKEL